MKEQALLKNITVRVPAGNLLSIAKQTPLLRLSDGAKMLFSKAENDHAGQSIETRLFTAQSAAKSSETYSIARSVIYAGALEQDVETLSLSSALAIVIHLLNLGLEERIKIVGEESLLLGIEPIQNKRSESSILYVYPGPITTLNLYAITGDPDFTWNPFSIWAFSRKTNE